MEATSGDGTVSDSERTANNENVLKKCIEDNYNDCVVELELNAHNKHRLDRKETPLLTLDKEASVKIQEMLSDKEKKYVNDSADEFKNLAEIAGGDFAKCI